MYEEEKKPQEKKQEATLKYKGFYKNINPKPTGETINIFVSDWNKEYFAFYVNISKDNYLTDIEEINKLINKLNYRDGDIYIELIDYEGELDGFYKWICDSCNYSHSEILNPEIWEILEEKGDFFFKCFNQLNGSNYLDDLKNTDYSSFNDWDEVLEVFNPDLYKTLDESNGLSCFDIESFYRFQGFYEVDDLIVLEDC